MRAIFISYRREDAEGQAGRLFTDLVQHFGEESVFMDVAGIEPGRDFRKAIDDHVAACGVLLAVIGKNWCGAKDEAGGRRLDDPHDFVRLETASALRRDIPVVPVLVQGARMPQAAQLPADLADLAFRNAIELTHARWDSDVSVLVKALSRHVTAPPARHASERNAPPVKDGKHRWRMIAGALSIAVALAGLTYGLTKPPLAPPVDEQRGGAQRDEHARMKGEETQRSDVRRNDSASNDSASNASKSNASASNESKSTTTKARSTQARSATDQAPAEQTPSNPSPSNPPPSDPPQLTTITPTFPPRDTSRTQRGGSMTVTVSSDPPEATPPVEHAPSTSGINLATPDPRKD